MFERIRKAIIRFFWPEHESEVALKKAAGHYKAYLGEAEEKQLKQALDAYQEAYESSKPTYSKYPLIAYNYGTALHMHYRLSRDSDDELRLVIQLFNAAFDIWKNKTPRPQGFPYLLINQGNAYMDRYYKTNSASNFNTAKEKYDQVRREDSFPPSIRGTALVLLGTALTRRCEQDPTSDPGQLDTAIKRLIEASTLFGEQAVDKANCLRDLGSAYDVRYQRKKLAADLESAIDKNEEALQLLPDGHVDKAPTLYNVSRQYFERFIQKEAQDDLHKAEEAAREAQELMPSGDLHGKIADHLTTMERKKNRKDTMESYISVDTDADSGIAQQAL